MYSTPQNYKRIFEELYPYRRPLDLAPKNECGVPKFVCTTLRPTQVSVGCAPPSGPRR